MTKDYVLAPSSETFAPEAATLTSKRRRPLWVWVGWSVLAVVVVVAIIVTVVVVVNVNKPVLPGLVVHPAGIGDERLIVIKKDGLTHSPVKFIEENKLENIPANVIDCDDDTFPSSDQVCRFSHLWLGDDCSEASGWGYRTGRPCIHLSVTKVLNWIPEVYQSLEELPEDMPQDMKDQIEQIIMINIKMPKMLWVSCEGLNPADRENLGPLKYSPWTGFPLQYFPYKDYLAYMSPIVAVQLLKPKRGVAIGMECRMWAKNIDPKTSAITINLMLE
ncbi:sodium/potassium-transporting ATPase subunit beta-like [Panulirus ornatus]|uniref:sodium/potassium-transporting ATPase subunit beta-like n=1 Tax=Panulirus ornatus TaxID=150431 RepID=UPI003A896B42